MNAQDTLKAITDEVKSARKVLKQAERRCKDYLWHIDDDTTIGQPRLDADQSLRAVTTLTAALKVLSTI